MSDLNEAKQAAIAKIKKAKMETAPKEESSQKKREQLHGELGEQLNEASKVKHVIGVVSGKGGVGKSFVTAMLACQLAKEGKRTAILDGDITGPSIPKMFGLKDQVLHNGVGIVPGITDKYKIQVMSLNLILNDETEPVIWRGGLIAGAVKQFWTDTIWTDVDVMFVDMPPGTGDVPLTVYQSLPIDGIVVVTTPQDLVSMIVEKAVKMAEKMRIPVLGMVENMAYFTCPDCGKKIQVFGESHAKELADELKIPKVISLPIDPQVASFSDQGKIEEYKTDPLADFISLD